MKVLLLGGTGLLGSAAAKVFIDRGHEVKTIALPPLPEGAPIPEEMEITWGNFLEISDEDMEKAMEGCDAFVYAAGIDERVECPPPVYEAYKKFNIEPLERFLPMAKKAGIKHCTVLGSYFAWLAFWPFSRKNHIACGSEGSYENRERLCGTFNQRASEGDAPILR